MLRGKSYEGLANVIGLLLFSILHIYLGRIESWLSFVTPPICAFVMANISGDVRDLGSRLVGSTDQDGVKAVNLFTWLLIGFTIAFYAMGFIDRG